MAAEPQILLPLPPAPPVLLPLPPAPLLLLAPPARSRIPWRLLLLAMAASGAAMRKFLAELGKEILSDPKRAQVWLARMLNPASTPGPRNAGLIVAATTGERVCFPLIRELIHAFIAKSTFKGLAVVIATLLLLHAGRVEEEEEEEDEEAFRHGRLPGFVHDGVMKLFVPPTPPPAMLPHQLRDRDLREMLRMERLFPMLTSNSSDFKEIVSMPHHIIKGKAAHKDGLKKTEEATSSVATEIQSMVQDTSNKFENKRQTFLKTLLKTSKECEGSLKTEYTKFEATHDKFCKDKAAHVQNFKGVRGHVALSSIGKTVAEKIAAAEVSVKMKLGSARFGTGPDDAGLIPL